MKAVIFKAILDVRSRRFQSLSIVVVLTLAAFLLVLSSSMLSEADAPFNRLFQRLHGAHAWIFFPTATPSPSALAAISQNSSTIAVSPPLPAVTSGIILSGNKQQVIVIGLPAEQLPLGQLLIVSGTYLTNSTPDGIVVDQQLALKDNLYVGATLDLATPSGPRRLPVVGISIDVNHGAAGEGTSRIYLLASRMFPLFGNSSQRFTLVGVRIADPAAVHLYESQLSQQLAASGANFGFLSDWLAIQDTYTQFFKLAMLLLLVFGVVAIVASGLVIVNLITGLLLTQARDIGILKTLGFTPGQVAAMYVTEYLTLALIATFIGLIAGLLVAPLVLMKIANSLGTTSVSSFTPPMLLTIILGVAVVVVVFSAFPSWKAGHISSINAIKGTFPAVRDRLSWVAATAYKLHLPPVWLIGTGQSFARPWRFALTTFSLIIMLCTAIVTVSLFTTIDAYSTPDAEGIYSSVLVTPGLYSEAATQELLSRQPSVSSYYTIVSNSFKLENNPSFFSMQFLAGNIAPIRAHLIQGRWYDAEAREMVMPISTLNNLQLHVGDSLRLGKPLQMTMRIVGVYSATYTGAPALADQAILPALTERARNVMTFAVTLAPHTNIVTWTHQLLMASSYRINVTIQDPNPPAQVGILKAALVLPSVLLGIVAAISVLNTVLLTTRERYYELGVLKALGMTPRDVLDMVQVSAVLYVLVASVVGIPTGVLLTTWLFQVIAHAQGFGIIQTSINGLWLLLLVPVSLFVALLGSYLPGQRAAFVDAAEILHAQ